MIRDSEFIHIGEFDMIKSQVDQDVQTKRKDKNFTRRMNRRGLKPQHLRHNLKAEDSVETSTEDE